ncbi:MAG: hypothetical protein WBL29_00475 [Burkholderiales bacterium]
MGAALTIAALVLAASAVTGREESRAPAAVTVPADAPAPSPAADDLDVARLKRPKAEGAPPDLFAPRQAPAPAAPLVAAAVEKPAPPPPPSAPPLPFKYLGRMIDNDKVVLFLGRNQESFAAAAGETLDGTYLVESIGESAVQFVYLPLGTKQSLVIAAQN